MGTFWEGMVGRGLVVSRVTLACGQVAHCRPGGLQCPTEVLRRRGGAPPGPLPIQCRIPRGVLAGFGRPDRTLPGGVRVWLSQTAPPSRILGSLRWASAHRFEGGALPGRHVPPIALKRRNGSRRSDPPLPLQPIGSLQAPISEGSRVAAGSQPGSQLVSNWGPRPYPPGYPPPDHPRGSPRRPVLGVLTGPPR